MARVKGKIALVTGGASGIGRGCAQLLAKEGAALVVTDVQDEMGRECVAAIKQAGGDALYLHHDVTNEEDWIATIAQVKRRFGRLDVLVNNAGVCVTGPVTEIALGDWRKQQAINVEGVFLGTKHALPLMRAGGGGSIVNLSSVAGLFGSPNFSAYCATKGAVRLFTKAVAMECAALKDGMRVNSVHPGIIDTPIWEGIFAGAASTLAPGTNARPNVDDLSTTLVPTGVKGLPDDIAQGVLYLASDDARYVTGSELVIDGGITAG